MGEAQWKCVDCLDSEFIPLITLLHCDAVAHEFSPCSLAYRHKSKLVLESLPCLSTVCQCCMERDPGQLLSCPTKNSLCLILMS
jgi:hypothetical protein